MPVDAYGLLGGLTRYSPKASTGITISLSGLG